MIPRRWSLRSFPYPARPRLRDKSIVPPSITSMVSVVAAIDEPRGIGQLQVGMCDIWHEYGVLRIEGHLRSAAIYQVDESSI